MEPKVTEELAEAEFYRFAEAMDLDVDPKGMDDEDKKSFVECKRKLTRAMMDGRLVVDDQGQPVFTPSASEDKSPITFYEPMGASLMAMDLKKDGHNITKMLACTADLTKQDIRRFSKMSNRDIKIALAITTLFLA